MNRFTAVLLSILLPFAAVGQEVPDASKTEADARLEEAVKKARESAKKAIEQKKKAPAPPKIPPRVVNSSTKKLGPPEGATFFVDPEAGHLLERARGFLEGGRPDFSVEVWREVLRNYGSTLTTSDDWVQKGPLSKAEYRLFRRLREDVEKEISSYGDDVLRAYRVHADAEAKALLKDPDSEQRVEALTTVVNQFFLSELGDDAAYELACLSLDRWDFVGAFNLLKMIETHPSPSIPEGEIALRMAVAAFGA